MRSRTRADEVELFRAERERLRGEHAAGASGLRLARALSDAVDRVVRGVWTAVTPGEPAALVAVGGYGRRELCPGSDIDLMVLYRKRPKSPDAARDLLYPLWDTGMTVGHSVRTLKEALAIARTDLDAETAFLDARLVTGDAGLFDELVAAVRRQTLRSSERFLDRIRAATAERHGRAGDASAELEPNLKEGRGGLRDLHTIGWIESVTGRRPERVAGHRLAEARDTLYRVRTTLHHLTGRATDVLLAEIQAEVAAALGYPSPDGDAGRPPAEDALMRDVYRQCRTVAFALDLMLDLETADAVRRIPARTFAAPGWRAEDRDLFLGVLAEGAAALPAFRALEEEGALERALPEWEAVRCLPQRNVYHRFAVDVHSIRTVCELVALRAGPDDLLARVAEDIVKQWETLLLAALFHDIGKGSHSDHSVGGAELAREAVARMGMPDDVVEDVAWLVRRHLLLSQTATRRNIGDESLVVELAEQIGTAERLRMLFLLSAADALATGPQAWTPWKATLVKDLFVRVHHVIQEGELVTPDATELAHLRLGELAGALADSPREDVERHVQAMPRAWLISQPPDGLVHQSRLMLRPAAGEGVTLEVRRGETSRVREVTVVARDRPGLLSKVAGALALHGLNVLAGQFYTRDDGLALQVFRVETVDSEAHRFERVRQDVEKALRGRVALDVRLAEKRRDYAKKLRKSRGEAPRVVVDNAASDFYTIIEVHASDQIGLLHTITRALADLELDIHHARVATYGDNVVDAFYVWDLDGQKVTDAEHIAEIEQTILHRIRAEGRS